MFKKAKGDKIKIEFTIHVQSINDVPKTLAGHSCCLEIKRGKKPKNLRTSKAVNLKEGTTPWEEKFTWDLSLFQKPGSKVLEPKKQLLFTFKEDKKDKKGVLGKAVLEVNKYAEPGTKWEVLKLPKEGERKAPSLALKVESKLLKIGDKVATPVSKSDGAKENGKEKEKDKAKAGAGANTVVVAGDEYDLHTADEMSEAASDSDDNYDSQFPEDDSASTDSGPAKPVKGDHRRGSDDVRQPERGVRGASGGSGGGGGGGDGGHTSAAVEMIKEQYETELRDLRKDKERLDKKVKKLQEDLKAAKEENEALSAGGASGSISRQSEGSDAGDADGLRIELDDARRDRERLQRKVDRLTKDNAELKAQLEEAKEHVVFARSNSAREEEIRQQEAEAKAVADRKRKEAEDKIKEEERARGRGGSAKTGKKEENKLEHELKVANAAVDSISKELSEAQAQLRKAEQALDDVFGAVVSGVEKHSVAQKSPAAEDLAHWLCFACTTFRVLHEEVPESAGVRIEEFEKPDLLTDLDNTSHVERLMHELLSLSFDVFNCLLRPVFTQFDRFLSTLLDFNPSKAEHLPPEFTSTFAEALRCLKKSSVDDVVVRHFVVEAFSYIDGHLFNSLLKQPNTFTCSRGFEIKRCLAAIEGTLARAVKQSVGAPIAGASLHFIGEASNLLMLDKSIVADPETRSQIFSYLNDLQINHFVRSFKSDDMSPTPVPDKVKRDLEDDAAKARSTCRLELDTSELHRVNIMFAGDL